MSQDDYNLVRSIIYNNTITTMQTILEYCETFDLKEQVAPGNLEAFDKVMAADENDDLDPELGQAIAALWGDAGVQATWDRRSDFQIVESLKYYFKNIERISQPDYMNKDSYTREEALTYQQDALLARVRTSGIVTETYAIPVDSKFPDGPTKMFEMYDGLAEIISMGPGVAIAFKRTTPAVQRGKKNGLRLAEFGRAARGGDDRDRPRRRPALGLSTRHPAAVLRPVGGISTRRPP